MDHYNLRARLSLVTATVLSVFCECALASHPCLTPQPGFSYVDADNDGCYSDGVDSGSIDADLQAAPAMAGMPSYVAPADTGIVVPGKLLLPIDADPFWSVPNDVWIDGKIVGPSSLRIEAGGDTNIHGSIRLRAQGFSNEGDLRLGCFSGCGPTNIGSGVKLANNGLLLVYDASIGDGVTVKASCSPGGVPSCGGSAYFYRATLIGDGFRLLSPGGIVFEDGIVPLVIGSDLDLRTKAVRTDGGVLGFSVRFELPAGVSIGDRARLRAGGSMTIEGRVDSDPVTGPIDIGNDAYFSASTVVLRGAAIELGSGGRLKGLPDISIPGRLSTVALLTADGALQLGSETEIAAGRIYLNAGAGDLMTGAVELSTSSADQEIELIGGVVNVGAGSELRKSTADSTPVLVEAMSSITIDQGSLQGAGLDISLSDAAGTIAFTGNEATGSEGTTATFAAPLGGVCDLSGSTFTKLTLDTSGCGSVVGP